MTYGDAFDELGNEISPFGNILNSIILSDLSKELTYGGYIFNDIAEVYFFNDLIKCYIQRTSGVNNDQTTQQIDFNIENDYQIDKPIGVSLRRNLNGFPFCNSKHFDSMQIKEVVDKFFTSNMSISNLKQVEVDQYLLKKDLLNSESRGEDSSLYHIHSMLCTYNTSFILEEIKNSNKKLSMNTTRIIYCFDFSTLQNIILIINDIDHIRIEYLIENNSIKPFFDFMENLTDLDFYFNPSYGYISPILKFFGNGINLEAKKNLSEVPNDEVISIYKSKIPTLIIDRHDKELTLKYGSLFGKTEIEMIKSFGDIRKGLNAELNKN